MLIFKFSLGVCSSFLLAMTSLVVVSHSFPIDLRLHEAKSLVIARRRYDDEANLLMGALVKIFISHLYADTQFFFRGFASSCLLAMTKDAGASSFLLAMTSLVVVSHSFPIDLRLHEAKSLVIARRRYDDEANLPMAANRK